MSNLVFFDLDDTLISTNSFDRFIFFLYKEYPHPLNLWNLLRISFLRKTRCISSEDFKDGILAPFRGMAAEEFENLCLRFSKRLRGYHINDALCVLKAHQKNGDHLVIISGALFEYARFIAKDFEITKIISTKAELMDGLLTGKIIRPEVLGEQKVHYASEIVGQMKGSFDKVISYSDSITDLPLLKFSDQGYLINNRPPDKDFLPAHIECLTWR